VDSLIDLSGPNILGKLVETDQAARRGMCLLGMDLAGIQQIPPNLDSPSAPARVGTVSLRERKSAGLGRVLNRQDACLSAYLEARSRASLSSRSIFC
jgi:hypothetical protein